MTFKEFYKKSTYGALDMEWLPKDVKEDLLTRIDNEDKHIGVFIYASHILGEDGHLHCDGYYISYYWRHFSLRFPWKMKRVYRCEK